MSHQEETYLCLLCLRDSTARIARLYWTYINLRFLYGDVPPVLLMMLSVLCDKRQGLHQRLKTNFPEYMAAKKWHGQEEQNHHLGEMSDESQADLKQICTTEMRMLQLISVMMEP
ncbi:MAG: hypothetical protein ACR2PT_08295 [Endozoicomonas sp.]